VVEHPLSDQVDSNPLELERQRDPADERTLAVTRTGTGRALRAEAEKVPAAVFERLGMPVAELEALQSVLAKVIAAAR
jgi:DNA-binding MarR family transcriptional regulator